LRPRGGSAGGGRPALSPRAADPHERHSYRPDVRRVRPTRTSGTPTGRMVAAAGFEPLGVHDLGHKRVALVAVAYQRAADSCRTARA
jgi:hypothetical protein